MTDDLAFVAAMTLTRNPTRAESERLHALAERYLAHRFETPETVGVGETDVSPERRYELSVLVGPCSEKEAHDLVAGLVEASKRLGGAVSCAPYDEEAEAALVAEQGAGLSADRVGGASTLYDRALTEPGAVKLASGPWTGPPPGRERGPGSVSVYDWAAEND